MVDIVELGATKAPPIEVSGATEEGALTAGTSLFSVLIPHKLADPPQSSASALRCKASMMAMRSV